MLPTFPQRLLILALILLGGSLLGWSSGWLGASDGSEGLTLIEAARNHPLLTAGWVLILGLVATGAAVLGRLGSRVSAALALAAALTVMAWQSGSAEGWFRRMADLHGGAAYRHLILESSVWLIVWFAWLLGMGAWSRQFPGLAKHRRGLGWGPRLSGLVAGAITAVVGGVMAYIIIQTTARGQVIFGLLVAFTIGGLVSRLFVHRAGPIPVLLSPLLVACIGYALVGLQLQDPGALSAAWRSESQALRLGFALPIHYASAGVLGASLGLGLGGMFDDAQWMPDEPEPMPDAAQP